MRRYADYLAGRGIDRIEQIDEAVVAAFLVSLRAGDDDHPHWALAPPPAPSWPSAAGTGSASARD